jgi:hypothetical protein
MGGRPTLRAAAKEGLKGRGEKRETRLVDTRGVLAPRPLGRDGLPVLVSLTMVAFICCDLVFYSKNKTKIMLDWISVND